MKIIIIGSGNVAYHLAKAFCQNNIAVAQIFGRNLEQLRDIGEELKIPFSNTQLETADLYIISVKDDAISKVAEKITPRNALVAHTSGSQPKDILKPHTRQAVFYPLQTFSKIKDLDYSKIPFFLEANNESDINLLKNLAEKISPRVKQSNFEQRKYLHLAAVFCCNFVNHLFAKTEEISQQHEIPFDYFLPLIEETVDKIKEISPKEAQTGPAIRRDEKVLEAHRKLIKDTYALAIYTTMNASIKEMYQNKTE